MFRHSSWGRIAVLGGALGLVLLMGFIGQETVRADTSDTSCQSVCIRHCEAELEWCLNQGNSQQQCVNEYSACKHGCQDNPPCAGGDPGPGDDDDPCVRSWGPPSVDPDGSFTPIDFGVCQETLDRPR